MARDSIANGIADFLDAKAAGRMFNANNFDMRTAGMRGLYKQDSPYQFPILTYDNNQGYSNSSRSYGAQSLSLGSVAYNPASTVSNDNWYEGAPESAPDYDVNVVGAAAWPGAAETQSATVPEPPSGTAIDQESHCI